MSTAAATASARASSSPAQGPRQTRWGRWEAQWRSEKRRMSSVRAMMKPSWRLWRGETADPEKSAYTSSQRETALRRVKWRETGQVDREARAALARRASAPVGLGRFASWVASVRTSERATRPTQRSLAARECNSLGLGRGVERERERGDGGGVGAGVTVDARCARAGRDAGEGHVVVVGAVGFLALEDGGNGGKEGGGARVKGVIDVGAHGAVEAGDVDGIESGADGDVRDGEEAGLCVKMEVSAGVVLAVHGAVEGPDGAVGLAGFGWGPDVGELGEDVGMKVGAEEVLGVDGEVEDDGGGDDGADGSLWSDGGGGDGVGLVPVAVSGHAEASPLGGFAVPAVGFVGYAPKVVEDLFAGGDVGGWEGRLAVDRVEDVELGAFGRVPSWVRRGVDQRDVGAGVGEGAAEAVGGGVRFHGRAGGLHGAVARGDGGVDWVVVADQEAWQGAGDGGSWAGTVSAGGVVAGSVGHGQDEVGRESGGFGGDAEVGLADGAVMALIATDAPRCLRWYGAPVKTHGREGVDERVVFDLGTAVCQCGVGAAPNTKPGDKEDCKHGLAGHGGNAAAEAKVSVAARYVEDLQAMSRRTRSSLRNNRNLAVTEVYVSYLGRSSCLYCESAVVRRGLKRE